MLCFLTCKIYKSSAQDFNHKILISQFLEALFDVCLRQIAEAGNVWVFSDFRFQRSFLLGCRQSLDTHVDHVELQIRLEGSQ